MNIGESFFAPYHFRTSRSHVAAHTPTSGTFLKKLLNHVSPLSIENCVRRGNNDVQRFLLSENPSQELDALFENVGFVSNRAVNRIELYYSPVWEAAAKYSGGITAVLMHELSHAFLSEEADKLAKIGAIFSMPTAILGRIAGAFSTSSESKGQRSFGDVDIALNDFLIAWENDYNEFIVPAIKNYKIRENKLS